MGAAALTLGGGEYLIHGTNMPNSIGGFVSYGCIRQDILDLYGRVSVGIVHAAGARSPWVSASILRRCATASRAPSLRVKISNVSLSSSVTGVKARSVWARAAALCGRGGTSR
jgi:hypothetical protein